LAAKSWVTPNCGRPTARNPIDPGEETAYAEIWWLQREMLVSSFVTPLHADPRWKELMSEPA